MKRADRFALLLSALAILAAYLVSDRIFERLAHIEDEMAYLWQAQVIARDQLTLPSPIEPKSFLVPFVIDFNGQRFGKYPLGWPIILSLGVRLGVPYLVNPLLAGLGVWLTYRLGKTVFSETVGLVAAGLTLSSPFFLMNSGSLLSHPFGLVLSAGFALAWLDAFTRPELPRRWLPTLTAAGALGALALTRPMTAAAVALPFGFHGIYLLWSGNSGVRKRLVVFVLIVLAIGLLHFAWQYAVTGDPFLNPYTLWWEYDKIGFGPGYGHTAGGHSLHMARINNRLSFRSGWHDLFGWAGYSWLFLPFGLFALRKNPRGWLLASVVVSLVFVYMAYWIGSALFGPRYYYEGLFSLTLVSAAGFCWLAGWPVQGTNSFPNFTGFQKSRPLAMTALISLLLAANIFGYMPARLDTMRGLYGVERKHQQPFLTDAASKLTPALIVVHTGADWIDYGTLIELQNPFFDTPFVFIISRSVEQDRAAAAAFPDRKVYHYYADTPYTFYTAPRAP